MLRAAALLGLVLALVLLPVAAHAPRSARADTATVITVTSTGDDGGDDAACPDDSNCTLRKAIETINADDSLEPFIISFSLAVFPPESPATVAVSGTALPAISHDSVSIDATPAGVVIDGADAPAGANGLELSGAGSSVRGLQIRNFPGACLAISGAQSIVGGTGPSQGNHLGGCITAIDIRGDETAVVGNTVGFADATPAGAIGIAIDAAGVVVGEEGGVAAGNRIGGVSVGIRVGDGTTAAFNGVRITGNVFGKAANADPAPLDVGVQLRQNSTGTAVTKNVFANTGVAAIQVAATVSGVGVMQNTFSANSFEALTGMAIDLNADGVRNPNDTPDADTGANDLLNYPVFSRATQARIAGQACAGCKIEISVVQHHPGFVGDEPSQPLATGVLTADGSGAFSLDSPPLTPGQWIAATATDAAGNTSEFSPSTRIGAGIIQCGNTELVAGWNHAGYFGADTLVLGATVPGDALGRIRAIYRMVDGTGQYEQWLRDTTVGRTLTTLNPGEAYWFLVDDSVTLPGGFALNQPLSIPVQPGWNDAVYFGASADVRDAFSSVTGLYLDLNRWTPGSGWSAWGTADTPGWARGFSQAEACGAYLFQMTAAATLVPLQP